MSLPSSPMLPLQQQQQQQQLPLSRPPSRSERMLRDALLRDDRDRERSAHHHHNRRNHHHHHHHHHHHSGHAPSSPDDPAFGLFLQSTSTGTIASASTSTSTSLGAGTAAPTATTRMSHPRLPRNKSTSHVPSAPSPHAPLAVPRRHTSPSPPPSQRRSAPSRRSWTPASSAPHSSPLPSASLSSSAPAPPAPIPPAQQLQLLQQHRPSRPHSPTLASPTPGTTPPHEQVLRARLERVLRAARAHSAAALLPPEEEDPWDAEAPLSHTRGTGHSPTSSVSSRAPLTPPETPPHPAADAGAEDMDVDGGPASSSGVVGSVVRAPTPVASPRFNVRQASARCRLIEGYVSFASVEGLGMPEGMDLDAVDERHGDEEDEQARAAGHHHGLSEKLGLGRLNANMRAWRVWPWLASSTGAVAPNTAEREVTAAS